MAKYMIKRILLMIPVLLGVTFIVFTILHLTPGDPARLILGDGATLEAIERYRAENGLNDPFFAQYFRYLGNLLLRADIGTSYATHQPVAQVLLECLPTTLRLAFTSMTFATFLGIGFGVLSAVNYHTPVDTMTTVFVLIGISMPVFWLGLLLILAFSVHLRWLPASGFDSLAQMILPSVALGAQSVSVIAQMTRTSMLEVTQQDYVRTARAKGLRPGAVILHHEIGNALIPTITSIGLQFGGLVGGAVLTESVFSIPGIGRLMVESIKMRDYPVVQGGVLLISFAYCIINLVVDLLYAWVDPHIRLQYQPVGRKRRRTG